MTRLSSTRFVIFLLAAALLPLALGARTGPRSEQATAHPLIDSRSPELPAISPLAPDASTARHKRRAKLAGPFEAELVSVIDGDTFEARVRVWFGQDILTLVRWRGIDAPEMKARCGEEDEGARKAHDYLERLLKSGAIQLHDVALDKYGGRIVASARVKTPDQSEQDVSTAMLNSNLATPYAGKRRASWCDLAKAKETYARK